MTAFEIIIAGLAGYRIALLLVEERGPFNAFGRLRRWFRGWEGHDGKFYPRPGYGVLTCIYCCSVWATMAAAGLTQIHPATTFLVAVVAAMAIPVVLDSLRDRHH